MSAADVQHMKDIEIPVIEITEGWAASDVKTADDYEDAFSYLMAAVAQIEFQIEVENIKPPAQRDKLWLARASCALKYKKAALQIIAHSRARQSERERRAVQERRDRVVLDHIKASVPHSTFMEWVRTSGVENADRGAAQAESEAA